MRKSLSRKEITSILMALLVGAACIWMSVLDTTRQTLQKERTELRHVRHGLLDVSVWKAKLADLVAHELQQVEISASARAEVRTGIEKAVTAAAQEGARSLMNDLRTRWPAPLLTASGLDATLQRMTETLIASRAFKAGASTMSDEAIRMLESRLRADTLHNGSKNQIDGEASDIDGNLDRRHRESILKKYQTKDPVTALGHIEKQMNKVIRYQDLNALLIVTCLVFLISPAMIQGGANRTDIITLAFTATSLLATAIYLPMMTIEATISRFSVLLSGQKIEFSGQVLFHQSKSILEIAWVMIKTLELGPVAVAILVILFSVLFPLGKLLSTVVIGLKELRPCGRLMNFLVFDGGKWSMADVFIVAIFMAYIGFNGVIDYQLGELVNLHPDISIETRNDTGFEIGFYLFVAYCLCGIALGIVLKRSMTESRYIR